jgi:acyl-CoA synthetase (AMP-forming)/AMP-acid ligase II
MGDKMTVAVTQSYIAAFDSTIDAFRDEVAITDGIEGADTTYAELAESSERVAAGLLRAGIGVGDSFAIAMEPSAVYLAVVLGCLRLGVAVAPLNTRLAIPELTGYLTKTEISAGVADPAHAELVASLPGSFTVLESADRHVPLRQRLEGIVDDALTPAFDQSNSSALILPTGGTTGVPKAASMSHASLLASATASSKFQHQSDTELWCTPLFHVGLAMLPLGALLVGARLRILPRFDVDAAIASLGDSRPVTGLSLTYTLYRALRTHQQFETLSRSNVRRISCGGASLTAANCQQIHEDWPDAQLSFGYASTEFGRACVTDFDEIQSHGFRGVGRPVPGAVITIRDEEGREVPPNTEGLITVRSPWSCDHYVNDDIQTAVTWTPNGVQVGDIGVVDDDGWFMLRGRSGDMIKTGGEIVYPADVESVLNDHPWIAEVIVYGVPDEQWGERVEAAVVCQADTGLTSEGVRSFARGKTAGYKIPKSVRFYDTLPRTGTGKVDRRWLRAEAVRLADAETSSES